MLITSPPPPPPPPLSLLPLTPEWTRIAASTRCQHTISPSCLLPLWCAHPPKISPWSMTFLSRDTLSRSLSSNTNHFSHDLWFFTFSCCRPLFFVHLIVASLIMGDTARDIMWHHTWFLVCMTSLSRAKNEKKFMYCCMYWTLVVVWSIYSVLWNFVLKFWTLLVFYACARRKARKRKPRFVRWVLRHCTKWRTASRAKCGFYPKSCTVLR